MKAKRSSWLQRPMVGCAERDRREAVKRQAAAARARFEKPKAEPGKP